MGLFDAVIGSFLNNNPQASPLQSVLGSIMGGQQNYTGQGGYPSQPQPGIAGLVSSFEQAGLGHLVSSWVGNGQNLPVSPSQLQQVFNPDQIQQWAQQSGLPVGSLLSQLAQYLPHAIDHATPNGEIPPFLQPGVQTQSSPFDDAGR